MRILLRLLGYLRHHWRAVALAYLSLAGGLAIVAFSVGKGLCAYLQSYLGEYLSQSVAYDLRRDFYHKVQSLSFAFHDQIDTGQLMSRATVDVEVARPSL